MINRYELQNNWMLKVAASSNLPQEIKYPSAGISAMVPGTVYTDLLACQLIDNPFYADNEVKLKWVEDQIWIYENIFDCPKNFCGKGPVFLVFEGIDTIADISLNGKKIGQTANMFRTYQYDVSDQLKSNKNILRIVIQPPRIFAKKIQQEINQLPSARHSERVFIRKAQYSFGWDWGPAFPTSGIWRPVYLEHKEKIRINSIRFDTKSIKKNSAKVQAVIELLGETSGCVLKTMLSDGQHTYTREISTDRAVTFKIDWQLDNPLLWWPNGMGDPNLWELSIQLIDENAQILDQQKKNVAVRTIELVLEEKGKNTFRFLVNSKPVFVKGANWIPADSFLPRIGEERYHLLLDLARRAHMNMIRVWGGGIYENDVFYDLCDKFGLMVWQDFMFACAAYPEDEVFVNDVMEEVKQNVLRLQTHACISIWCGNNENEWIWHRDNCGKIDKMPGFSLFHHIIPDLLKRLDPGRPYWPTTPFGHEDDPNDFQSGNRHAWDIWSRWIDYTEVIKDHSKFVTEFGFQGPADYTTMSRVIPQEEMHPHSMLFEFHNKQEEGPERLTRFLAGHLPLTTDIKGYIYLTQINQGLALKTCLDHWRQNWPETNGSIIWQLNDCWPVSSWSLIDWEKKPKPAYYFVKRSFAPVSLFFHSSSKAVSLKISKHQRQGFKGMLYLSRFSSKEGQELDSFQFAVRIPVVINIFNLKLPPETTLSDDRYIFVARLHDETGIEISRTCYFAGRWKHARLRKAIIRKKLTKHMGNSILMLTSDRLALYVTFTHPEFVFADNALILLPQEKYPVRILSDTQQPESVNEIDVFSLNQFMME